MKHRNIFSKDYTENWSRGTFWIDSVMKNSPLTYKIKDSNGEKIIGTFCQKELLSSRLQMSYYPKQESQFRDKVKVVLDLSDYSTKRELKDVTGVDTSNLAAKRDFIALKAQVGKLDINKLVNLPSDLNNFNTKIDDLDAGKLRTVPIDLKKLCDVVSKENIKKGQFVVQT